MSEDVKKRSWFSKPEGKTGIGFLLAMIVGGGFLLYKFLPFLITLLSNAITAGLLGVGLFALIWVLRNKQVRAIGFYGFKMLMKGITSIFITLDPITIVESYISSLKSNIIEMDNNISKLKGEMENLRNKIEKNEKNIKNYVAIAKKIKTKCATQDEFAIKASNELAMLGELKDSNERLINMRIKLKKLYEVLIKMYEVSLKTVQRLEARVEIKRDEHRAIKSAYNVFKNAKKILMGDGEKAEIFEKSMEELQKDISTKVGYMERFMEISQNVINKMDIENDIYTDEGMKLLEELEKSSYQEIFKSGEDINSLLDTDFSSHALEMGEKEYADFDSKSYSKKNSKSKNADNLF